MDRRGKNLGRILGMGVNYEEESLKLATEADVVYKGNTYAWVSDDTLV